MIGRFIGLVRALAPFIAGTSRMPYRDFAPFSILGTGLWSTGLILAGYFAAQSLDTVTKIVGKGLFVFAIVIGVAVAPVPRLPVPARAREPRAYRGGDGEAPGASAHPGARAAPAPPVRVPRPAADSWRARPRADDAARGPLGGHLRRDRLLVGGLGRPGAYIRRPHRAQRRRRPAGPLADERRQGAHQSRLGMGHLAARRPRGRRSGAHRVGGWSSGCWSPA